MPDNTTSKDDELHKRLVEIASSYSGYLAVGTMIDKKLWQAMWGQVEAEVKQYGTQERMKGKLVQAEATRDKWNETDTASEYRFGTFLEGQVEAHRYDLAALKDKENKL